MIGQLVSHYKILENLGSGGMGVVYKARDLKLDRTVALKFLPPELVHDPDAKQRFIHEAKAASALQHNNICVVYDVDQTPDGQMFFSMEYLEGETLKKKIEQGLLPIEDGVEIAIQLAQGLAKAHEQGIVHRDIKPANIMITSDGVAKIVDFGLAKLSGRTMLTRAGSTLGTAAYMAPEQARGEPADRRSDIWSLGVVIFEMLTGRRPFEAEYENALLYSILNSPPQTVTALRPGIPMDLERIVQRCLSKDPRERYQHADELLVDLRSSARSASAIQAAGPTSPGTAQIPGKTTRLVRYGAATLGIAVLAAIGYFFWPHGNDAAPGLKKIAVLPFENLGPAEDEYFADGLTDEITSRLSSISKLGVISRTSSMQYKKTTKTLPVVAKELGVDYILEGTVRWVKTGSGERIRITPQLIKVSGDLQLWADNIDRTLDDIFAVQTEIATRVVKSLDIALGESERHTVEAIPTKNLAAYQAYLRGLSFSGRSEAVNTEMGIEMFRRAVDLDSTFALAYAQLAVMHLRYYWWGYDRSQERLSAARECLDRVFALQSDLAEAYVARGYYYYWGYRDYARALEAYAVAEKKLPNNSRVLEGVAYVWRRQGKFEEAAERLKQAFELDPQAANTVGQIGETYCELGKYAEAESYLDRSISLLPDQAYAYLWKARTYLRSHGDTNHARSELDRVPAAYNPWMELAWLDIYERNYQAALERLDHAPVRTLVEQERTTPVSQMKGLVYRFMNDPARSRMSFDSARVFLESEIARDPDDYRLHQSLGIVYAGLGRTDEAVREALRAVDLIPVSLDAYSGVIPLVMLAQVYTMTGRHEAALTRLEYIMSLQAPKVITPALLQLDPTWDALRDTPRFQALLAKHG